MGRESEKNLSFLFRRFRLVGRETLTCNKVGLPGQLFRISRQCGSWYWTVRLQSDPLLGGARPVRHGYFGVIPTNPDILGKAGYSALFHGYSVWVYGDTFIAKANAEDQTLS